MKKRWTVIGGGALTIVACTTVGCSATTGESEDVGKTAEAVSNHWVQVGTRCQQDYQNGWQVDVGNNDVWNRCWNFKSTMATYEVSAYYYNLHGAANAFTTPDTCGWPCGWVDAVDFFYTNTHGGINSTQAFFAMWDQNSLAYTRSMRLGASGRENMVFTTFACDTHATDGNTWTRWSSAFSGGLYISNGGHKSLYAGNDQSATEYANRMNGGEPIVRSWLESTWYADNRNGPTGITTGVNSTDCFNRQGITIDTLFSSPILRDGAIGYWCYSSWD